MLGGIETECYDQRAGRKGLDRLSRRVQRLQIGVVAGSDRQRDIEVGAETGALAPLMCIAPHERIVIFGVGMDGDGQHISA